ncbi:hypothetical protein [Bartonella sp. CM120XJJH]|uniref:hypothetical protein n=1 Tax=Bartonella sp. CM120XJJH TaxID=3243544 RepID=UPI0035D0E7A4
MCVGVLAEACAGVLAEVCVGGRAEACVGMPAGVCVCGGVVCCQRVCSSLKISEPAALITIC